jgi:hypothetical protein
MCARANVAGALNERFWAQEREPIHSACNIDRGAQAHSLTTWRYS